MSVSPVSTHLLDTAQVYVALGYSIIPVWGAPPLMGAAVQRQTIAILLPISGVGDRIDSLVKLALVLACAGYDQTHGFHQRSQWENNPTSALKIRDTERSAFTYIVCK